MPDSRTDLRGRQAERTLLAWERTALALLVNGVLLLVRQVRVGGVTVLVPAALALAAMVLVAVLGRLRARRLRDLARTGPGGRVAPAVAGAAVLVVGLAVVAALVLGSGG